MARKPEKTPSYMIPHYISGIELARYLAALNVNAACWRCGHETWHVHDTEDYLGVSMELLPAPEKSSLHSLPVVSMECDKCGTLWFMTRGAVQKWLEQNPAPESAEPWSPEENESEDENA